MANFLFDTFTDTNGTTILSHTGELGASWSSTTLPLGAARILSNEAAGTAGNQLGYASGTPASADYSVTARVKIYSSMTDNYGVLARVQPGFQQWYSITIVGSVFHCYKNAASLLGQVNVNHVAGEYDVTIEVSGSSTTTIKGRMQRVSDGYWLNSSGTWQVSQTDALSVTDSSSPVTAAGKAGMWIGTADGSTGATLQSIVGFTGSAPDPTSSDYNASESAIFKSPYNWRTVGTAIRTNNPGAYIKTLFTGTSCSLLVDTSHQGALSADNYPVVAWSVDDGAIQRSKLTAGQTSLTLATGLADTSHKLKVWLAAAWWLSDRWTTPISDLRVTGISLGVGETIASPTIKTGRVILYGDSNAEGYEAIQLGVDVDYQDATLAFGELIGNALDAEIGVVGFAGQGYLNTGGGNVPGLSTAWDDYSNGQTRLSAGLFSPEPDWIVCCHGQNDAAAVDATLQSTIETLIDAWRVAAPDANIAVCDPMTRTKASVISAAVTAAADAKCKYVSIAASYDTDFYTNGNHLTGLRGHPAYGAEIVGGIQESFANNGLSESEVIVLSHVLGRPIF